MAALESDSFAESQEWELVKKGAPIHVSSEAVRPKGKAARRNAKKRQEREAAAAIEAQMAEVMEGRLVKDELLCPGLTKALAASLSLDSGGDHETGVAETAEASRQRRLKALAKRLKAIEVLASKERNELDESQRAKLDRREEVEAEIATIEAEAKAAEEEQVASAVRMIGV
jgi:hypothetical protein